MLSDNVMFMDNVSSLQSKLLKKIIYILKDYELLYRGIPYICNSGFWIETYPLALYGVLNEDTYICILFNGVRLNSGQNRNSW